MIDSHLQQAAILARQMASLNEVSFSLGSWNWQIGNILGVAIVIEVYLYRLMVVSRRYGWPAKLRIFSYLAGSLILLACLSTPLAVFDGDYPFSTRMIQEILIAGIVPPLLLLGIPDWLARPVLITPRLAPFSKFFTRPAIAFIVFNGAFWLWHLPVFYELTLADERFHFLQLLTLLVCGLVNWWTLLSPVRELPRLGNPLQILYLFANLQPNVFLGAMLVFSHSAFYRSALDATHLTSIPALADQQLSGLILWIPGNAIYLIAASIIFLRWFREA